MATSSEILSALKKAHEAGDTRSAKILADKYREMNSAGQSANEDSVGPRGFMPFLNRGIASSIASPADLVHAGLGAVGVPVSDTRPSETIAQGMRAIGVNPASESATPETIPEYIGRGVGSAAGFLIPGSAALKVASTVGGPLMRSVSSSISRPFIEAPARALGAEVASGAGAGIGEAIADRYSGGSTIGNMAGSVLGGVIGGMTPAAIMNYGPTRAAARFAADQIAPFTDSGAFNRAANRVQSLVENRDAARSGLSAQNLSDLSPAVSTNEPRLMQLERSVRDRNPQIDLSLREREAGALSDLSNMAYSSVRDTTVQQARDALNARMAGVTSTIDTRVAKALDAARTKTESLSPDAPQSFYSRAVRDELDSAYKDARAQEREIWRAVPDDVSVNISDAKNQYDSIVKDTPSARMDDIPVKAKSFLSDDGKFGESETVKEIHGLYSAMREDSRIARADGKANKARISDRIADALMSDMERAPNVSEPLSAALAFSRKLNETYRQGDIGRVLGSEKTGGARVAPELTLDATIGSGGIKGALAIDDLRAATNSDLPALENYISGAFSKSAVRDGRILPRQADSFLIKNKEMLSRVPDVRNSIIEALTAQTAVDSLSGRLANVTKGLSSGPASTFAKSVHGNEVASILKSQNPPYYARQAMLQAKDKGDGVKRAFLDDLFEKSRFSRSGNANPGARVMDSLADESYRETISQVFTPIEMQRIDRIGSEMARIGNMQNAKNIGSIMGDTPDTILSYIVRIASARAGARLGRDSGASLQTAGFASSRAKKILNKLNTNKSEDIIIRAISGDKELFDSLLIPISEITKKQETRLIETLAGVTGYQSDNKRKGEQ